MKNIFVLIIALLLTVQAFSQTVQDIGTLKYIDLEGGFYGIITDKDKCYYPLQLRDEYKKDGLRIKFTGILRDDVMTFVQWGQNIEITEIEQLFCDINRADYEVHEWGVMVGCPEDNTFFMTSRPERVTYVKQPVLYFHSKDKKPFYLKVDFANGKPTDTYPVAELFPNSLVWNEVIFTEPKKQKGIVEETKNFVPLQEIIPVLNDVDADLLSYKDTESRFLFYEGEVNFMNYVTAEHNSYSKEVKIKNGFGFPVYNVVFTKGGGDFWNPEYYSCKIDTLKPYEEITVNYKEQEVNYWTDDLSSLGFTEKEAKSFSRLWDTPFLRYSNTAGWANLIYRIPQEELEKMIMLTFDPQPSKLIRVLYMMVHLH